mgnify:CR=1 FL=1
MSEVTINGQNLTIGGDLVTIGDSNMSFIIGPAGPVTQDSYFTPPENRPYSLPETPDGAFREAVDGDVLKTIKIQYASAAGGNKDFRLYEADANGRPTTRLVAEILNVALPATGSTSTYVVFDIEVSWPLPDIGTNYTISHKTSVGDDGNNVRVARQNSSGALTTNDSAATGFPAAWPADPSSGDVVMGVWATGITESPTDSSPTLTNQLSTVGNGAMVQLQGIGMALVKYSAAAPSDETGSFLLKRKDGMVTFPAITGMAIWATENVSAVELT